MKRSVAQKTVQSREEAAENRAAMIALFQQHWDTHPDKKCEVCGTQLYGENLSIYHDHLLEYSRARWSHLALEIDNLILVCGQCHGMKTGGFPLPKHEAAIEQAKIRFNV